ncbi:MAG: penicillin-binding transpeptidase domain-containing protein [Candidatus Levyibacteriota bacterium]
MKIGAAFSDEVHTGIASKRHTSEHAARNMRGYFFGVFIFLCSVTLLGRLFILQILQGEYYRNLSDSNRTHTTIIHAPRGIIFDRNGKPLVYNVPGFRETVNGKTNLLTQSEAIGKLSSGISLAIDSLREYPLADAASHVVGYIGQITPDDLKTPQFAGYQQGDLIGKMGIEEEYESLLRGTDGQTISEVDATGKVIRKLGQTDPIPGQNVTITLDSSLQQQVAKAMSGVQKGAAIVENPTGEVLAMVSKPSFDPNLFTMGENVVVSSTSAYKTVEQVLLDNSSQPFLNRTIGGTYPPGSTFKLVTAAAGLESGQIDRNFTVEDTGILKVGDFSFANWYYTDYGKTEGTVDIVKAIQRSNDIFFYKVGEKIGVDTISQEAAKFGVGHTLGIDMSGEAKGLLPTKEWKKQAIGEDWYLGDDYHYAIGQGYLLTTPLQVNAWTQALANGGTLYKPHLLKAQSPQTLDKNFLNTNTVSLIRQGMIEACSTGGVAWPLFDFKVKNAKLPIDGKNFLPVEGASGSADMRFVSIACKTGTAQHGDSSTMPHAWITLFAPAYHPQIIVTVLSESSGEGSNVAGPIAKEILTDWFTR